ncbi:MAG: AbrB/MazE/SpoVT family DNA-binding domain-containing protein [Chloroflexota bacterium]|nr:AbrB/MazE/SpoVT family DNA-binding domain-containing protein [Chloroflexota bacterium]
MKVISARVSSKYEVVVPKFVRERLGLKPKTTVLFLVDGDTMIVRPCPEDFTATLRGLHEDLWPDPEEWLEEERASWA